MDGDGIVVGIAAVFAGTTVLFTVLAAVYQPFLLLFAAIFGAATYLLWYHASGSLGERVKRTAGSARRRRSAAAGGPRDFEGFGPGRRAAEAPGERARGGGGRSDGRRRPGGRGPDANDLTRSEAYRTLGLDPGADQAAVKAAYRERVKAAHPDTDSGDREEFKEINRAYERLRE